MTQITIPAVPSFISYAVASPTTGPFVVPFAFFDEGDVKATVTDALGVPTALVHGVDFTFNVLNAPVPQEGELIFRINLDLGQIDAHEQQG